MFKFCFASLQWFCNTGIDLLSIRQMQEVDQKVLQYESFLNETLRGDLQKITTLRDGCYEEISQYLQLKTIIENSLSKQENSFPHVQVDLGCNFYAKAVVTDPSKVFVRVGYGFFLELTYSEAISFITKKTKYLNNVVENLSKDIAAIRAQIRMVIEGLCELQNLNDTS
ncbi:protein UXT-like [Clavelina lepadiformis]|uniref:Protein UXT n=1 Tax=Clavelina lepadiformis TaxID=159417 RepID=A0ABP0H1E3_CLALP